MNWWLKTIFWVLLCITIASYLHEFWVVVHEDFMRSNETSKFTGEEVYVETDDKWRILKEGDAASKKFNVRINLESGEAANRSSTVAGEVFVPTNEWQTIKEGQAIPKGLHVRINLQTGVKEAKLLSSEANKSNGEKTSLVVTPDVDEPDQKLKYEYLEKVLKKIPDEGDFPLDVENEIEKVKKKFRTYEELKEEMSKLNLHVKTDLEVLDELMAKYNGTSVGKNFNSQKEDELESVLKDLEYLLHQVDNAKEFARRDGIKTIIVPCLNTNVSIQVRTLAAQALGAAVQNNGKVQVAALDAGVISPLIRNIAFEKDYELRSSCIYALSCLIRSFPIAELSLIDEGGLTVLMSVFQEDSPESLKLQLKIVTFFNDLIVEKEDAQLTMKEKEASTNMTEEMPFEEFKQISEKVRQYKMAEFSSKLTELGWCSAVGNLLASKSVRRGGSNVKYETLGEEDVNHEVVDTTTNALLSVADQCKAPLQASKLYGTLTQLLKYYARISVDETDDKFYTGLRENLDKLCEKFKIK